jgi:hypothetical protein
MGFLKVFDGLPDANMHCPLLHVYASIAEISDWLVGFDRGKMSGIGWLLHSSSMMSCSIMAAREHVKIMQAKSNNVFNNTHLQSGD